MARTAGPQGGLCRRRALGDLIGGLIGGLAGGRIGEVAAGVPGAVATPQDRAQVSPAAASAAASPLPFPVDLVRTGLYRIGGDGGNVLMRLSAAGIALVDGKPPEQYRALRRQIARLNRFGDLPLRVLFLTDLQPRHAGSVEALRAAGVAVVVPRRVAALLAPAASAASASGAGAAPVVPFDGDYRLQLGGVPLHALHVGPARSADSTLVHFPDMRVLAVGDLLPATAPLPDFPAGGSLAGWLAALDRALALDADLIVPGDGPPVPQAQLAAFRARLGRWIDRARTLLADGADAERFVAGLGEADPDWRFVPTPAQWQALRRDLAGGR